MWNHTLIAFTSQKLMWNQSMIVFMWKQFDFAENLCQIILLYSVSQIFCETKFSFTNFLWNWISFVLFSQIFCQIKTALPTINRDHFCNSDQFGFGFHWINIKNKLLLWNLWTHPLSLYWVWRPYTCKDSKTLPHPFSALWKSMILAESLNMGF